MKVIESLIKGKFDKEKFCEDAIFISDEFIVLIDGATAKSDFLFNGKKTGKLISEILVEAFEKLEYRSTGYECIEYLNDYILKWYKKNNIYNEIVKEISKPTASVIIYSKYHHQIWLIGDCTALYNGKLLDNKLAVDKLYIDIRIKLVDYLLKTGCTEKDLLKEDESLEFIKHITKRQPLIQNKIFGHEYDYAVVDGFNNVKELIIIVELDEDVKEIVFSSDGYPKLYPTLKESEKYLNYIKENDPLCYKIFKNFKAIYYGQVSYDDRSYIRFEV